MSYQCPTQSLEVSQVIKKSQFIGNLAKVNNAEEATHFVQKIKGNHHSANHSCHCFIAGLPEQFSMWGYSDDGEPKGTAGLPMFQVLKHSGMGNVCVVVTRYFGGIKLGTGGIARAYSSTVNLALSECITQAVHSAKNYCITAPFNRTGEIEHSIKLSSGVKVTQRQWLDKGLQLTLSIDDITLEQFTSSLSAYQHEIAFSEIKSK